MKPKDFNGLLVTHSTFGLGKIDKLEYNVEYDTYYLHVSFSNKTCKFQFPSVFKYHLTINDKKANDYIKSLLKNDTTNTEEKIFNKVTKKQYMDKHKKK